MCTALLPLAHNMGWNKELVCIVPNKWLKLHDIARRPVQYNKIKLVTAGISEKKTSLC